MEDYVESLFRRAAGSGAEVRLISTESEEGEMLQKAFGGIAALLRYPVGLPDVGPGPPSVVASATSPVRPRVS